MTPLEIIVVIQLFSIVFLYILLLGLTKRVMQLDEIVELKGKTLTLLTDSHRVHYNQFKKLIELMHEAGAHPDQQPQDKDTLQ